MQKSKTKKQFTSGEDDVILSSPSNELAGLILKKEFGYSRSPQTISKRRSFLKKLGKESVVVSKLGSAKVKSLFRAHVKQAKNKLQSTPIEEQAVPFTVLPSKKKKEGFVLTFKGSSIFFTERPKKVTVTENEITVD